jgi:hypothetical protein
MKKIKQKEFNEDILNTNEMLTDYEFSVKLLYEQQPLDFEQE